MEGSSDGEMERGRVVGRRERDGEIKVDVE